MLDNFNILLSDKYLHHPISRYLIRRSPLYMEPVLLNFLADPALVDADVLKILTEFVMFFCDYSHSLLVVHTK